MTSTDPRLALSAPLTGTLRYPLNDLLDLGRRILLDYQSHLEVLETAADEADDDDKMWEAKDSLNDVSEITWLLDRKRWKEEQAKKRGEPFPKDAEQAREMERLNEPKDAAKSLLIMGANFKAEHVIPAAVKLRREKRGDPPEGSWKNEDALLDLLEFISKSEHSGLFRAPEDDS